MSDTKIRKFIQDCSHLTLLQLSSSSFNGSMAREPYNHHEHQVFKAANRLHWQLMDGQIPISSAEHENRLLVDAKSSQLPPCRWGTQCIGLTSTLSWVPDDFPGVVWAQYLTEEEWKQYHALGPVLYSPPPRSCILCFRQACTQWLVVARLAGVQFKPQTPAIHGQLYSNESSTAGQLTYRTELLLQPDQRVGLLAPVVGLHAQSLQVVRDGDGWRCDQSLLFA
jgi:hypothetical protein